MHSFIQSIHPFIYFNLSINLTCDVLCVCAVHAVDFSPAVLWSCTWVLSSHIFWPCNYFVADVYQREPFLQVMLRVCHQAKLMVELSSHCLSILQNAPGHQETTRWSVWHDTICQLQHCRQQSKQNERTKIQSTEMKLLLSDERCTTIKRIANDYVRKRVDMYSM